LSAAVGRLSSILLPDGLHCACEFYTQPPAHMGGGQKADTVKVQVTETVRFGT